MENIDFKPWLIFFISLLLLLINLGRPDIYILDEAKNAECAREMFLSGDYIVPRFNAQLRTDKPPLHYFFMALSYRLFDVSAFSARFFSAVFGACTILISYLFARRFLGEKTGILTAVVLLSSLHFNFQMRLAVPDPYLIFFITASIYCFYLFLDSQKLIWLFLMYFSLGLGVLTKGPVAIVLPGLAMLLFLLVTRQLKWKVIARFRLAVGILLVVAIALPWFVLNYIATNGVWTEGFFLKHNLERFTNTMEGHGGFFLLPEIMVILGLVPFGVFAVRSYILAIIGRNRSVLVLSVLTVTVIIVFFSFSRTQLPNYTAPAYPFAATLIANLLARTLDQNKIYKAELIIYSVIALAIPIGVYIAFQNDKDYSSFTRLAFCFLALPVGVIVSWIGYFIKSSKLIIYALSASFIITNALFFILAYPSVYQKNPVNASANILASSTDLVYYKKLNPAYIFKLTKIIPGVDSPELLRKYMEVHPRALIISRLEFAEEIGSVIAVDTLFKARDTFERPVTAVFKAKIQHGGVFGKQSTVSEAPALQLQSQ